MAVQFVQPHRFTAEQYRRMARIGVVPEHGTELIEGVVVEGTRPFRFSADDYLRLGAEGVINEDERVELIDGEIIEMSPIGARHSECVARLLKLLVSLAGEAEVRIQDQLWLSGDYQPQPDGAVYVPRPPEYDPKPRTAGEALLLVEVADSSLLFDRTVKTEQYAEAGIPEYWLVDLKRDLVVVSRAPVGGQFTEVREYRHGGRWTSPALGGAAIDAAALLGPARP